MFVNFSNHSSGGWSENQRQAACDLGVTIVDYPFPEVSASMSEQELIRLADRVSGEILDLNPEYVMAQGEFTLTYAVIQRLKRRGVTVLAACSERNVTEVEENGRLKKIVQFEFVRFRVYEA